MKISNKKILFIHFRSYGDTIISFNTLIPIMSVNSNIKVDIITNDYGCIYLFNKFLKPNKIYFTNYPLSFRISNISIKNILNFAKLIFHLRANKYDYCLNLFSALRENLFGYFVNPKENIAPYWNKNHSFRNTVKRPNYLIKRKIHVPVNKKNVYNISDYIVKHFGLTKIVHKDISNNNKIIGIHPFARQKCRLWSFEKWNKLIKLINNWGFSVWIFCSKDELNSSQYYFRDVINDKNSIHAYSLEIFVEELSKISLLIGLDSFSIHMAYFLNIPRIMLNGANDPEIWAPPNTKVFSNGYKCKFHPCYNKPRCIGSDFEFICIKSIDVNEIYSYLINILTDRKYK